MSCFQLIVYVISYFFNVFDLCNSCPTMIWHKILHSILVNCFISIDFVPIAFKLLWSFYLLFFLPKWFLLKDRRWSYRGMLFFLRRIVLLGLVKIQCQFSHSSRDETSSIFGSRSMCSGALWINSFEIMNQFVL